MSHEFSSGVMMHNTPAWHGLGEVIQGTLPARDAFQRAGALFPVELIKLWAGDPTRDTLLEELNKLCRTQYNFELATALEDGTSPLADGVDLHAAMREAIGQHMISMAENRTGIWRPDERRILGTAGPDYRVIPNDRLLQFAEAIREEVDMDTVIVLRNGAKVAFTAKIRGTNSEVVPGDAVYRNIVGYLGHDGVTGMGGLYTDVRVVCANTLGFAMNDANRHGRQFSIRHTENDVAQIDRILGNIDIARQSFEQVVDDYRALREVSMSVDFYRTWLEQVYQVPAVKDAYGNERAGRIEDMPRKWAALEHAWSYGLGREIPGVAGTAYWGLNCVTEVESSLLTKGSGKRRFHSALFGSGSAVIKRANESARQLVNA